MTKRNITMANLYTLTVCSYLQYLTSAIGCLEKARDQANALGISYEDMVNASLFPNMQPLHFQIIAIAHFSETAMHAAFSGEISGPNMDLALDFQGLIEHLQTAHTNIARLDEKEINTLAEGDVIFEYSGINLPFTTEDFFLSYALPSFYFHVSIAYGILRSLGVHIGVANFLGTVRTTPSKNLPESVNQLTGEQYLETLKPLALP
jgi:hypothetical protein